MSEETRKRLLEIVKISKERELTESEKTELIELDQENLESLEAEAQEEVRLTITTQLSVRERLMRRKTVKRIDTVFIDDVGDFVVKTRLFKPHERQTVLESMNKMNTLEGDLTQYSEAITGLRGVCKEIDMNVGEDFWDSEYATDDVVVAVILNTLSGGLEAVGEGMKSFRANPRRPANVPNMA